MRRIRKRGPRRARGRVVEELRHDLVDTATSSTGQSSNSAYFNSSIPTPVAHDVATTRTTRSSARLERRDGFEKVDLVEDDELRSRLEPGAVLGELPVDRAEPLFEVRLGGVEHVDEESRALEMREELVAETGAVGSTLDEAGHVGDGELALVRPVDDAEDGLERRERVVGDLRLRVRETAEERRLAGVREAGERRVDHELETKLELELVARKAGLGEARRLTRGVANRALPRPPCPPRATTTRPSGTARSATSRALARRAAASRPAREARSPHRRLRASAPAPVASACRPDLPDPAKGGKVAQARVHGYDHVPSAAAVATVGPALRDVLLAAEAQATVAAAAGLDLDVCSVVEHGLPGRAGPPPLLARLGSRDRDEALVAGATELDGAVAEREDRVVTTEPGTGAGAELVPRWRTMIIPVLTACPAKILTPSRFASESRPLREEPRPFLAPPGLDPPSLCERSLQQRRPRPSLRRAPAPRRAQRRSRHASARPQLLMS